MKGALIGKVGNVFTSSAIQHGGQESTILSFHTTLLHQGMVIVGVPYSCADQMRTDEITGGSPYGATTIAGRDGKRMPSANELGIARFQENMWRKSQNAWRHADWIYHCFWAFGFVCRFHPAA